MQQANPRGLYDPSFEHDSCGFGLIANIDGKASAWLVDQAFSTLGKMSHRGGIGADGVTGDGVQLREAVLHLATAVEGAERVAAVGH